MPHPVWVSLQPDPYPWLRQLRETGAAVRFEGLDPGGTWVALRYRTVESLFRDPRLVRDRNHPVLLAQRGGHRERPIRGIGIDLVSSDPPTHTRLRRLVTPAFSGRVVQALGGKIEALAHTLLDRAVAAGRLELIADYSEPIPLKIICDMLGLPERAALDFRWLIDQLNRGTYRGYRKLWLMWQRWQFLKLLRGEIETRRREPRDDLLTALVRAESEGDRLSVDELLAMTFLLLVGGYFTSMHLIGNATLALLRHPDQLDWLRADPNRFQTAVDEFIRFDGPLSMTPAYYTVADVEVDGGVIPCGSTVRMSLLSANHDEAMFSAPDRLDLSRDPCSHLGFGHGIHYCLGATLARLEVGIALRVLFERLPQLRLAIPESQLVRSRFPIAHGFDTLPLQWGPS